MSGKHKIKMAKRANLNEKINIFFFYIKSEKKKKKKNRKKV